MSDLYLMKKVVILKTIQVMMKTFFPPFSTISVWAWSENTCGNESHEKETKQIYASDDDLLHIIDRWMQYLLIRLNLENSIN